MIERKRDGERGAERETEIHYSQPHSDCQIIQNLRLGQGLLSKTDALVNNSLDSYISELAGETTAHDHQGAPLAPRVKKNVSSSGNNKKNALAV